MQDVRKDDNNAQRRAAFVEAAKNGDFETVQAMLQPRDNPLMMDGIVNATDDDGNTALHHAAANGRLDLVRLLLLDHNANVTLVNRKWKRTALMTAILKTVEKFHDHYLTGLESLEAYENRPLIVHLLLERMAFTDNKRLNLMDHQDFQGYTALHWAAEMGSRSIVQEMLHWRPNLTLRNFLQDTALHSTIFWNESESNQLEKLQCFLEHTNGYSNADCSTLQDKYGRTVLHRVVKSRYHSLIEYLSPVVDVRVGDVNGDTALHLAVEKGLSQQCLDCIILRGHHGMDATNILNDRGRTALMNAIIQRITVAVIALCPVTDINISDNEGKTALHYAVQKRATIYVDILLERKVNLSTRDNEGRTAFALACCLDDDQDNLQLSMMFQLYRYGVAYGEQSNMI